MKLQEIPKHTVGSNYSGLLPEEQYRVFREHLTNEIIFIANKSEGVIEIAAYFRLYYGGAEIFKCHSNKSFRVVDGGHESEDENLAVVKMCFSLLLDHIDFMRKELVILPLRESLDVDELSRQEIQQGVHALHEALQSK